MAPSEALAATLEAVHELLTGRDAAAERDRQPGCGSPDRVLVGITGAPGAGKSTLAGALVAALTAARTATAVVVPMDGFHLANAELERLGLAGRKGAPATFDGHGFVHLLRRLRTSSGETVYAPTYSRALHESIGGAIAIPPQVRVVVVEGNYLLLDEEPWAAVRSLLDLACFLDAPDATRREGLVRRQVSRGLPLAEATAWVDDSDEANARLVAGTRGRADMVVRRSHRGLRLKSRNPGSASRDPIPWLKGWSR